MPGFNAFGFGAGFMTGLRTDLTGVQTPRQFGVMQDVTIEFTGDVKELFGSYQFPVDAARGKTKITGKAKVARVQGEAYNDLFFGQTLAAGQAKLVLPPGESFTPGSSSVSYTVALSASTPLADQGVFYNTATGQQLTASSTAAGTGTYAFNASTGVYTFASGDIGTGVLVSYSYTVATGVNIAIGNPFMGTTPRFQVTLFDVFEGSYINLVLNQAVSTRLTFPTRIDDYWIEELDFSAFANAANAVGTLSMAF
jgi:hypothetical protein